MQQKQIARWVALCSVAFGLILAGCGSTGSTQTAENNPGEEIDTGYGVQAKNDATGSSSTVSGDEVSQRDPGANDLHELLRGNVSGVDVFPTADGGVRVQIQGPGSPFGSSEPLYVVDGVAVEPMRNGRFPWVQPSNIESITVLKGSDASIYGVRGANGVIVIRTKNG